MKLGIVDLDTSHPQNWIPIERELGHEVVGVWDGGSVHPPSYVESFAQQYTIPTIYPGLTEMAAAVDCAIIHGCDWDTHIAKARPFIEAGKAVLLDKPLAGNLRDLQQLRQWVQAGARISGGSSLRFAVETQEWLAQPIAERGTPHTILCGCAVDEFNYGIHAYAMLSGIMGGGIRTVRHLSEGAQRRILVQWANGGHGILVIGATAKWMPFYATIVTERTVTHLQADNSKLYRALLEATLPYLAGETTTPPLTIDEWLEPELCALAARHSWLNRDQSVALADLDLDDVGYDGKVFAESYREAKYS